jgi:hypothetical protein
LKRLGYAAVGLSYLALAVGTFKVIADLGGLGQSSDQATRDWMARVVNLPFGVELVVLEGLVLAGIVVAQGYQAISGRFMMYTELGWVVADCTSMPKLCCNARAGMRLIDSQRLNQNAYKSLRNTASMAYADHQARDRCRVRCSSFLAFRSAVLANLLPTSC